MREDVDSNNNQGEGRDHDFCSRSDITAMIEESVVHLNSHRYCRTSQNYSLDSVCAFSAALQICAPTVNPDYLPEPVRIKHGLYSPLVTCSERSYVPNKNKMVDFYCKCIHKSLAIKKKNAILCIMFSFHSHGQRI